MNRLVRRSGQTTRYVCLQAMITHSCQLATDYDLSRERARCDAILYIRPAGRPVTSEREIEIEKQLYNYVVH